MLFYSNTCCYTAVKSCTWYCSAVGSAGVCYNRAFCSTAVDQYERLIRSPICTAVALQEGLQAQQTAHIDAHLAQDSNSLHATTTTAAD